MSLCRTVSIERRRSVCPLGSRVTFRIKFRMVGLQPGEDVLPELLGRLDEIVNILRVDHP